MDVIVNGVLHTVPVDATAAQASPQQADLFYRNGRSCTADTVLVAGDHLIALQQKKPVTTTALANLMRARYGDAYFNALQQARVAICGLGGLGSHIACALARLGVGHLLLIDFDRVDPTNLARQHYNLDHIGRHKTDALAEQLLASGTLSRLTLHTTRLNPDNIPGLLQDWPIVCEAFDRPDQKAMLIQTVRSALPQHVVVAGNGMAGIGPGNAIRTSTFGKHVYLVGDGQSEGEDGIGLMAPRVQLCAAAQATVVMRLILDPSTP